MKKRVFLGIGWGLILAVMSGTVQAGTIYDSIWSTRQSEGHIKLYDSNRREIQQQPRPENPGHTGLKGDNKPAKPKRPLSILDKPSG